MSQYLGVEQVSVHHCTFDVVQVGVMLQGSLQQSGLLTQLGNVCPVVMGEHLVSQNGIGHLKAKETTTKQDQALVKQTLQNTNTHTHNVKINHTITFDANSIC